MNQKNILLNKKKNDKKALILVYDKKIINFEKKIALLDYSNMEYEKKFKEQQGIIDLQQNLILTQQQMISNIQNMNLR